MNTPETSSAGASRSFFDQITSTVNTAANIYAQVKDAKNAGVRAEPASAPTKLPGDRPAWLPLAIIGGIVLVVIGFFAFRK